MTKVVYIRSQITEIMMFTILVKNNTEINCLIYIPKTDISNITLKNINYLLSRNKYVIVY